MNVESRGSGVSLQLLLMPDLRATLKTKNENERNPRQTEQRYGPKVLEGNWFNLRAKSAPWKNQWSTLYETSYRPCKKEKLPDDHYEAWDNRIRGQGLGTRVLMDHHGTAYHNNVTTTYDLSYRILPEGLHGPRPKTFAARKKEWVPQQNLSKNYGNLTSCGLMQGMKCKWFIESKELLRSWQTSYQAEFKKPCTSDTYEKRKVASWNETGLRHLNIDFSPHATCRIAHKLSNPSTYRAEMYYPRVEGSEAK